MQLVHKGSTKDVYQDGTHYVFKFSDRYSVFDWGEMPDHIPNKGSALALFTKKIYRHLEAQGIATHLIEADSPQDELTVRPFEVIRHQAKMPLKENIFIPLEVIFRLGVAKGSSLLKRKDKTFAEGQRFETPMIEFTTKLERFDRPLSHDEAKSLANLSEKEWNSLLETTTRIAIILEKLFKDQGIELWDGKVEFALGNQDGEGRRIILVDTIGPDELRLTKNGVQLSKEIIRQYYKKSPWFEKLDAVKKEFGEDFKKHIAPPDPLPKPFLIALEHLYRLLSSVILAEDKESQDNLDRLILELKEMGL